MPNWDNDKVTGLFRKAGAGNAFAGCQLDSLKRSCQIARVPNVAAGLTDCWMFVGSRADTVPLVAVLLGPEEW